MKDGSSYFLVFGTWYYCTHATAKVTHDDTQENMIRPHKFGQVIIMERDADTVSRYYSCIYSVYTWHSVVTRD